MEETSCEFSIVTNKYLRCYYRILNRMIHEMTYAQLKNSISYNFIVQMIPHHCAAIEMSRNLLRYTTDIPLQEIALGIIREQTKSIHDMKHILCQCSRVKNKPQDICHYQEHVQHITQIMFSDMRNACAENDINISFMHEMIPHHKGAIQMSKHALDFPICPGLVPILDAIIISQQKGVCQMEELLSEKCSAC